jgi:hypothetical protein
VPGRLPQHLVTVSCHGPAAALSWVLHLDEHLGEVVVRYGRATYAILFAIVFAETGAAALGLLKGGLARSGLEARPSGQSRPACLAASCAGTAASAPQLGSLGF